MCEQAAWLCENTPPETTMSAPNHELQGQHTLRRLTRATNNCPRGVNAAGQFFRAVVGRAEQTHGIAAHRP